MKQKLSIKESIFIGSMLFGLFFGAGNLIFPIHLGQTNRRECMACEFRFPNYDHWTTFSRYSSDWYLQNKWRLRYFISSE